MPGDDEKPKKRRKIEGPITEPQSGPLSMGERKVTPIDPAKMTFTGDAQKCFGDLQSVTDALNIKVQAYVSKRDAFDNILPTEEYGIRYTTEGENEKTINADRVVWKDFSQNKLLETGFIRSQFPQGVHRKRFLSWLLKEAGAQGKPYILNLLRRPEQVDESGDEIKYFSFNKVRSDDDDEDDDDDANRGLVDVRSHKDLGTSIKVSTIDVTGKDEIQSYELDIRKFDKDDNEVAETKCRMKNFTGWPDHGVVGVPVLSGLVDELLRAKREGHHPIVVHCRAGRGRTGTIVAGAVLKEAIENKTLGVTLENYKNVVCHLVLGLREGGGGDMFVQTEEQLDLLFKYTQSLISQ